METIKIIFSNYYINVAFLSWLTAQVLKTLLTFVLTKEVVWERMVGAGGMPSAHSALVCSLTVALERKLGFSSPEFALSLAFAAIVMYDAMGVRRAAGEQAKVLNKIVEMTSDNIKEMFAPKKKRAHERPQMAVFPPDGKLPALADGRLLNLRHRTAVRVSLSEANLCLLLS